MSGHSKWASIKHKKAATDAKRGRMFTKLLKEIEIAARIGGGDPDGNPRLRSAVQTARDASMPNDNINRAIKRGSGELAGVTFEDFLIEGYGQGGVAILVEGTTDNKNRTMPELRHVFQKYGGVMGAMGSVAWMFKKKGTIMVPAAGLDEDSVMEIALEAGAEDFASEEGYFRITTDSVSMDKVRKALEDKGIKVEASTLENIPDNTVKVEGDAAGKLLKLIEMIEENDDVKAVSANYDIDDSLIEKYSNE